MSNQEAENHDFDSYIRQKLGNLNPEYREEAWQDLEAKLDGIPSEIPMSPPSTYPIRNVYRWVAASVLLVGLGFLAYTLLNSSFSNTPTVPEDSEFNRSSLTEGTLPPRPLEVDTSRSSFSFKPEEFISSSEHSPQVSASLKTNRSPNDPLADQRDEQPRVEATRENQEKNRAHKNSQARQKALVSRNTPPKNSLFSETKSLSPIAEKTNSLTSGFTPRSSLAFLSSQTISYRYPVWESAPLSMEFSDQPEGAAPQGWWPRKYLIGLSGQVQQDYSNLAKQPSYSFSTGIHGEWKISSHWSLQTGFLYSPKKYELDGSANKVSLTSQGDIFLKRELRTVNSRLFDIPIALNYYLGVSPTWSFFLQAGFVSQFLQQQTLGEELKLVQANGIPIRELGLADIRKNTYEFSPFNGLLVGVGVQRRFSEHWFLQVQPYFQQNFRAIGQENTHMHSVGLRTSIWYGLGKR